MEDRTLSPGNKVDELEQSKVTRKAEHERSMGQHLKPRWKGKKHTQGVLWCPRATLILATQTQTFT